MSKNPYLPDPVPIIEIIPQSEIDYTFRLKTDLKAQNGQFLQLSIPGVGEAPISISDWGAGYIDLTIRRCGKLTDVLHELEVGDPLFIRGPYGNGFPIEEYKNKNLVIVAGGTGLAPVKSIVNHFYRNLKEVNSFQLITGFKSPQDILFADEIENWEKRFPVILTVDQSDEEWAGNEGLVTQYVDKLDLGDKENTQVIVVGPPLMMKFTVLKFLELGLSEDQIWVSYERKMCCGIGKCGHCKMDDTYICVEGPVFRYDQAKTLID